ncbi:ribosome-releasing factor 2, mitochondrial isoform X2 [Aethina tumida]|uniref:ribosome-releasing factor 2, mitochondrial isoform X2 n=1 Tax=Aethina tumida TaxID=116153 RepID=UPI002147C022|nr:ribosome-releasing factor 2, mitochondrial isoform X2 [Aethina tumida]
MNISLRIVNKLNAAWKIKHYSSNCNNWDGSKIRNIGILAHIDAGKTTTTERMLFFSGKIKQMGEVHHGNTVTDYMEQERERGITITSAAVTFPWKKHQFNLIDTPGHIDFTMEVEQTLNVLDGAVVILDGSAGVEAQTITVWKQSEKYKIPKVIFVNKMDRADANVFVSCDSVEKKLECPTIMLQLPVKENNKLLGIVDILSLNFIKYEKETFSRIELTEKENCKLWTEAVEARCNLIDKLTNFNDDLAYLVISNDSLENISTDAIVGALRKSTLDGVIVPVLLGSSYKNIGVQALMDAVILYLPSPLDRHAHFKYFEDNFCGRTFKVMHDKQKGPLVFTRIYNGELHKNQRLYNVQQDASESNTRVYVPYADEFKEVESVTNGNIAVIAGLKITKSGDLLTSSNSVFQKARSKLLKADDSVGDGVKDVFGSGPKPPQPVFFCSIEPPNLATQSALDQALEELQREDPSLRVNHNEETGQTVLAGMGELHLEIIRDRILKEYKINADLGPLQIAYKETPLEQVKKEYVVDTKIGNSKQQIEIKLSLIPVIDRISNDFLKFDKSAESASNISGIFPKHLLAIKQGIEVGLMHGPKIGAPLGEGRRIQ